MSSLDGILLVDKSIGMTSHDVVSRVRRILGTRSVGHAGTLDPAASGLLLLLIGEATKVSDYLLNGDKSYEVKVRLGVTTDSMDMTGQVLSEKPVDVSSDQIREAALALSGTLTLKVPIHSAVKVDGKRLYKFAHKGETPEVVPDREMTFFDLKVLDVGSRDVLVAMSCSKGSFVRAWANHLGEKLGCGGTVEVLRRIVSAPFSVKDAITLEDLETKWNERTERSGHVLGSAWIDLPDSLPHFARIDIEGHDETLLRNGQISKGLQALLLQNVRIGEAMPPVRVISRETDHLIALLLAEKGEFYRIKRVFQRT
ncbi:MAG TPA: tRNA pseudouridine(55) synthase TruB [Bdellovibrionales bacterium]|nr:tRNA pseudouridine(55) synthase TruB [Bdellovibrionales bacterium]